MTFAIDQWQHLFRFCIYFHEKAYKDGTEVWGAVGAVCDIQYLKHTALFHLITISLRPIVFSPLLSHTHGSSSHWSMVWQHEPLSRANWKKCSMWCKLTNYSGCTRTFPSPQPDGLRIPPGPALGRFWPSAWPSPAPLVAQRSVGHSLSGLIDSTCFCNQEMMNE